MRTLIVLISLTAVSCATKRTNETTTSSTTTASPQTSTEPTTQPSAAADAADAGSTDAAQPPPPDGEELYGHICVTCHGNTGDGKGLEQQLFSFGTPAEQWKNGPTVEGILKTLQDGVHNTSMAAFPNYGKVEREAIANYVLELRAELISE